MNPDVYKQKQLLTYEDFNSYDPHANIFFISLKRSFFLCTIETRHHIWLAMILTQYCWVAWSSWKTIKVFLEIIKVKVLLILMFIFVLIKTITGEENESN